MVEEKTKSPRGRKLGVPNKASIARQIKAARGGELPLDYLLRTMRNEGIEPDVRLDAAKAAAPYIHPRLAAVTHSSPDGGPVHVALTIHFRNPGE